MLKNYDTDKIITDEAQNLENPNLIHQWTNEQYVDYLYHSHSESASSSDVASVLSLISTALADLGTDTTEIDSAIAALSGEETTEEESTDEEETESEEDTETEDEETEEESESEEETESEEEAEATPVAE